MQKPEDDAAIRAWLAPLPPEGASALVHRSTAFAPAMAQAQGVDVASLHAHGMVEHIVDERGDAALEARAFCQRLGQAIEYELARLSTSDRAELMPRRLEKYRNVGALLPPHD